MKSLLHILFGVLLSLLASACSSADADAAQIYDSMTAIVEKHSKLKAEAKFDMKAYRSEIEPLEAKLAGLKIEDGEDASFSRRAAAAERYQDAILKLSEGLVP